MQLLPVPGDLPVERRARVNRPGAPLDVDAITFDFGNTLVPVDRASLHRVVEVTGERLVERLGPFRLEDFLAVWATERERQFREEVPNFREVDIAERLVRVLACLRGVPPPPDDEPWDQASAARHSTPDEIAWGVDVYSAAFVEAVPPPPGVAPLLADLAGDHRLAILSNWPLAATVDRYAEAAGWAPHLAAIVVSQRVGTIKPHPAIFREAERALGGPEPGRILHVGDDWAADVVGARAVGWRVAYLEGRPHDSPLPDSQRDGSVEPDLELRRLDQLPGSLVRRAGRGVAASR
jgi:HAD superfamily hydrolase (TIGR01509 family)